MPGNDGSIVTDILSFIVIFYLQVIDSGHADSSMVDKKRGKTKYVVNEYHAILKGHDATQKKIPHVVHFNVPHRWLI